MNIMNNSEEHCHLRKCHMKAADSSCTEKKKQQKHRETVDQDELNRKEKKVLGPKESAGFADIREENLLNFKGRVE